MSRHCRVLSLLRLSIVSYLGLGLVLGTELVLDLGLGLGSVSGIELILDSGSGFLRILFIVEY